MSSNTTDHDLIYLLEDIADKTNRYFSIFVFLFGVIGNLLNILVLSKKTLRKNSCSWLFLVSSIANLFAIVAGLTTRSLSTWAADPTATNAALCKLRAYVVLVSRTFAAWSIVLAVVDRWLTSCLDWQYRRHSQLKNAKYETIVLFIICFSLYLHLLYCYDSNMINTPLKCYYRFSWCLLLTDVISFCTLMVLPMFINCIFGLLTILNVRRSINRIRAAHGNPFPSKSERTGLNVIRSVVVANHHCTKKKNDRDLLSMLLFQVLLLVLFNLPIVCQKIYSLIRPKKTSLEVAIDSLVYNTAVVLAYLTNGMPFYIYTLSGGNLFRDALRKLFYMKRR